MSTATKPQPQATTAHKPPLDQVVHETERRQTVIGSAAEALGVPPGKLCDLLRNVWQTTKGSPPLTDQEMFTGLSLIARYGLDPIGKEIYVTRDKRGKLMTIIGIDGWVKVLDRTDHYDGFVQEDVVDDKGNLVGITTTIHSTKRSHPIRYPALMSEYRTFGGFVSQQAPVHMLRLFSLRHAARLFTPISGVCLEEEVAYAERDGDYREPVRMPTAIDDMGNLAKPIEQPESPVAAQERQQDATKAALNAELQPADGARSARKKATKPETLPVLEAVTAACNRIGFTGEQQTEYLQSMYGVATLTELSAEQLDAVGRYVANLEAQE